MALEQWEGPKPAHGDQVGVMAPVQVPVSLDVMAQIMTAREVEPSSINTVECVVRDFVRERAPRGGLNALALSVWIGAEPGRREQAQRNRMVIAALYGWEVED